MINSDKWQNFKENNPLKFEPYSKKNWGNKQHSLCSFYGKLKPAIAYHLIESFSSREDRIFDCFSGSGTIPFEAALNGRYSFGLDINPISVVLSKSKVGIQNPELCLSLIEELENFILTSDFDETEGNLHKSFGYNKSLVEYFHPDTYIEIIKARQFFKNLDLYNDPNVSYVISCLLHILHGNRPYALSRNSHPITPYAPTGDFIYKSLVDNLKDKCSRSFFNKNLDSFKPGKIFHGDILKEWDDDINDLSAIISSPPFFDSTKYHQVHWLRSWFLGWNEEDFKINKDSFIDEIQKKDFDIYNKILRNSKERLKNNGVVVFHLGKSKKKNMGYELSKIAKGIFNNIELFDEDVQHLEKHGIKDKGTVSAHQYLVMY
ncbi:SAM-dependent methyltransferase [Empedobacter sp. 225-1]|uniref:DNA methyltransferase n=1 Tax=Empedobacter sp. 225-1 TaxID=2746725 RepID=UPI002578C855|nr:DNA methyltransferase [Empedobacter sp. 225-1]MDM1521724.1 SAM-dependent methyltransferase [Empedobacter sp. 225-1]